MKSIAASPDLQLLNTDASNSSFKNLGTPGGVQLNFKLQWLSDKKTFSVCITRDMNADYSSYSTIIFLKFGMYV
jgi:hypothetical protein